MFGVDERAQKHGYEIMSLTLEDREGKGEWEERTEKTPRYGWEAK